MTAAGKDQTEIIEPQPGLNTSFDRLGIRSPGIWALGIKRVFDILVSALALAVLAPVFPIIGLIIKATAPDVPIIFGVEVIGRHGRPFRMWKFSTMVRNAHLILADILAADPMLKREWEENVKLMRDPRILPFIGGFLRKTSLNELPQLWNVLAGEMSLVAPRPITAAEEHKYLLYAGAEMLIARHELRPGITGLWQSTSRSDVNYKQRVDIDAQYLRMQSFRMDLRILWWTIGKVLSGRGAV